jgi:cbb3-type cytochrome oxidase subunit 3
LVGRLTNSEPAAIAFLVVLIAVGMIIYDRQHRNRYADSGKATLKQEIQAAVVAENWRPVATQLLDWQIPPADEHEAIAEVRWHKADPVTEPAFFWDIGLV